MSELAPADINIYVSMVIRNHPGKWLSPHFVWDEICRLAPEIAKQVSARVKQYQEPERNTEVWFVSNTFYHLGKSDEFELSDTDEVPEMRAPGKWAIIRKK